MHATQPLIMRYFLVLCLALTVFSIQCRAADKPQSAWNSINTRIMALSSFERRSIVLCVRGQFILNYDKTVKHNLSGDAKHQLWAWEVYSRASAQMSRLTEAAGWPGMSQYFRQEALDSSSVIRGQIDLMQYRTLTKKNESTLDAALKFEHPRLADHAANMQKHEKLCKDASSYVIGDAKLHASK